MAKNRKSKISTNKNLYRKVIGLVILLLVIIGTTYAAFTYSEIGKNKNTVVTGTIDMKYTESSNELILGNAVPISDEEGKQIEDSEKIFDFTLNINITGDFQVAYEVVAEKASTSTLEDKYVKLYLERSLDGTNYEEVMDPAIYTPIKEKSQFGAPAGSMILDTGIVNKSTKYYYRLRMWVDSSYAKVEAGETYEVKINSYGTTEKNTMDENKPVCTFGEYKELKINETSTVELICTDNTVGIEKKELVIADFVNSNKELGEIIEVSKAEKIASGYKYMLTLKGLSTGKFKIELPEDIIVDKLGNSNEAVSKEIEVKGLTYKVTYEIGSNVSSIGSSASSCTTTGNNTTCTVTLPIITANTGYTAVGWATSYGVSGVAAGTSYTLSDDITLYGNALDKTSPKITINTNSDTNYAMNHSLSVTITDNVSGLATDNSFKYGWSTSNSVAPSSYTSSPTPYQSSSTSMSYNVSGSGITGKYYLWIVPITIKDNVGNSSTASAISTGTFYFDNVKPSCGSWTGQNNNWTKQSVSIYLGCSDADSGCASSSYNVKNYTSGVTSTDNLSYSIRDNAGNTTTCSSSVNVYVDKVAPVCGGFSGGSTSWTSGNRTIYVACQGDSGSGCAASSYAVQTFSSGTTSTTNLSKTISDNVGNTTTCSSNVAVYVDKNGPVCGGFSGGSTSWTNGNRSIYVACQSDSGSGCAASSYFVQTFSSGETSSVSLSKTIGDNVGNTTTCSSSVNVYVDKVAPTVSTVINPYYCKTVGHNYGVELAWRDGGSGLNNSTARYSWLNANGWQSSSSWPSAQLCSTVNGSYSSSISDNAGNYQSTSGSY